MTFDPKIIGYIGMVIAAALALSPLGLGIYLTVRLVKAVSRKEEHLHWSKYYIAGIPFAFIGYALFIVGGIVPVGLAGTLFAFALKKLRKTAATSNTQNSQSSSERAWPPVPKDSRDD